MRDSIIPTILFLLLAATPLSAQQSGEKNVNIFTRFKLQVYEDDSPTRSFLVGHINVFQTSGQSQVRWYDVWVTPLDSERRVMLKPEYSSTDLGDIRSVVVGEGRFSFEFVLEQERVMRVSGTKITGSSGYDIQAVGLWWVALLKRSVKTEWKPVTKPIVLPYTELF